jgi:replicative DNA helicase
MELRSEKVEGVLKSSNHYFESLATKIEENYDFVGVPTKFAAIDKILGGFKAKTLNFISARPKVGKTNLLLNLCRKLSPAGFRIMYFDLESQGDLNHLRVASMYNKKNLLEVLQQNKPGSSQYKAVKAEIVKASKVLENVTYVSKSGMTINQIRDLIIPDLDLVIIDHFQKLKVERYTNRYERFAEIAEDLRVFADELGGTPVVLASQMNRASEQDKYATSSKLKGAGEIEENADSSIILQRCVDQDRRKVDKLQFVVDLNRHGKTGMGYLYFKDDWCLIENLEEEKDYFKGC